jgi:hypothetical protein
MEMKTLPRTALLDGCEPVVRPFVSGVRAALRLPSRPDNPGEEGKSHPYSGLLTY